MDNNLTMDHIKLYEVDLFHHYNFCAVLMGLPRKPKSHSCQILSAQTLPVTRLGLDRLQNEHQ